MRGYELVFITDPEINDKDLTVLLSKFKKSLKDFGGKLVHEHVWGIRKLAYEIKSNEYGMYHVWYFSGSGKTVDELQRQLGYSDNILRNQIVKVSDLDIETNFFKDKFFMDFLIFQAPMLMVQASLDGILLGILFALIAYGMALQWGVMNIINIAQGDLVILGGYIAYTMYLAGIHPAWGVIVSPIIMYFVGWALYKLVINKVVDRDLFISILATFGIAIVFQQLMNFIFGADVVVAQSEYGTTMLFDNSVTLPNSKIFSAFISVLYAIALVVYMKKSRLGRAIRATAQNARAAKILGVDTEKVYAATFGINAALCGIAGALISITLTLHPYVGLPYTVRSFMIVIVAGLGNLPAVAISGMGLGLFEEFADYILGTEFRIGAVFMLLVFILVYRRFKLSKKREYLK